MAAKENPKLPHFWMAVGASLLLRVLLLWKNLPGNCWKKPPFAVPVCYRPLILRLCADLGQGWTSYNPHCQQTELAACGDGDKFSFLGKTEKTKYCLLGIEKYLYFEAKLCCSERTLGFLSKGTSLWPPVQGPLAIICPDSLSRPWISGLLM